MHKPHSKHVTPACETTLNVQPALRLSLENVNKPLLDLLEQHYR